METFFVCLPKTQSEFYMDKGHDNNVENERCDFLAVSAAKDKKIIGLMLAMKIVLSALLYFNK